MVTLYRALYTLLYVWEFYYSRSKTEIFLIQVNFQKFYWISAISVAYRNVTFTTRWEHFQMLRGHVDVIQQSVGVASWSAHFVLKETLSEAWVANEILGNYPKSYLTDA